MIKKWPFKQKKKSCRDLALLLPKSPRSSSLVNLHLMYLQLSRARGAPSLWRPDLILAHIIASANRASNTCAHTCAKNTLPFIGHHLYSLWLPHYAKYIPRIPHRGGKLSHTFRSNKKIEQVLGSHAKARNLFFSNFYDQNIEKSFSKIFPYYFPKYTYFNVDHSY